MASGDDRVVVIGGGVVGLCAAHYLDRAGYRVAVLDRGKAGRGASWGNAGQISPDVAFPLPAPGMIREAARSLLNASGALYIPPRPNAALLRFLTGFTKYTTKERSEHGRRCLVDFTHDTRERFSALDTNGSIVGKSGYLYAYASEEKARAMFETKRAADAPVSGALLGRADLAALEPSLGAAAVAGFVLENQWWVDPARFVEGLVGDLRLRGVEILEGVRVTSIRENAVAAIVRTTSGDLEANSVVIASGIGSQALSRGLGVELNLYPGKGYSFSVPADPAPRLPIIIGGAHVVVTPMMGHVRVAGTMELDRDFDTIRPHRIAAMARAAGTYLRSVDWQRRSNEWVGTRVLTPDGLPVIGRLPGTNRVVVATGHNMLGVMLAPATGGLVTEIVSGNGPDGVAMAFDPRRVATPTRVS